MEHFVISLVNEGLCICPFRMLLTVELLLFIVCLSYISLINGRGIGIHLPIFLLVFDLSNGSAVDFIVYVLEAWIITVEIWRFEYIFLLEKVNLTTFGIRKVLFLT